MRTLFIALCLTLSPLLARADVDAISNAKAALLVTHASTAWDTLASAEKGVNAAIQAVKQAGGEVYYLMTSTLVTIPHGYYMKDRSPTDLVQSSGGEHGVLLNGNKVFLVGGFYDNCLRTTFHDVLKSASLGSNDPYDIYLVMDGIFENGFGMDSDPNTIAFLNSCGDRWQGDSLSRNLDPKRLYAYASKRLPVPDRSIRIEFMRKGKSVRTWGSGDKLFRLHLIMSKDIGSVI